MDPQIVLEYQLGCFRFELTEGRLETAVSPSLRVFEFARTRTDFPGPHLDPRPSRSRCALVIKFKEGNRLKTGAGDWGGFL